MVRRTCSALRHDGGPCGAPPGRENGLCRVHDPALAETVAEARRLGGHNRKREVLLTVVHDFEGLDCVADIKRLLEIAVTDCLATDRGLNRARTLAYLAQTATKLLQVGEHEERLAAIESAIGDRPALDRERRR